jgi:hypothetical protein
VARPWKALCIFLLAIKAVSKMRGVAGHVDKCPLKVNVVCSKVNSVYPLVNEIYAEASPFLLTFAVIFIRPFLPVNLSLNATRPRAWNSIYKSFVGKFLPTVSENFRLPHTINISLIALLNDEEKDAKERRRRNTP